jgi:MATE family multidrug resistance protein
MSLSLRLPVQYRSFLPRFYQLSTVGMLANIMVPLAGLFDSAFLGHLASIDQLAGVILGGILFDYLYRVLKFLRNSTNAMTAEEVGRNDQTAILQIGIRSSLIALGIATVILVLQSPIRTLGFALLSGSPAIEASGVEYFNARIWGAPAVLLNFVLIGWFLGREQKSMVLILSLVGNCTNVLLDYLMIMRWGWGSGGAGLATALSQYLALLFALIGIATTIPWQLVPKAFQAALDRSALKATLALKSNILVRFLILISTFALFTNFSAALGTQTLAENGLLLQIAFLSQFTVQGVGLTTQTLVSNFKSKGAFDQLFPVLTTAILNSQIIALAFALLSIRFPDTVFGLLTSHRDVSQSIAQYAGWLLPLLSLTALAFMLEGYFIGLKAGDTLRNASLIAFCVGFLPMALVGWYTQNNHLLWSSLVIYMAAISLLLGLPLLGNEPAARLVKAENPAKV